MIIRENSQRYPVKKMCKLLGVSRSSFYAYKEPVVKTDIYENIVCGIFRDNRKCYGTRRIKAACSKKGIVVSRRRIARIMRHNGLVSTYTTLKFKPTKSTVNEDKIANVLDRNFDNHEPMQTIVSDLTYVRVASRWFYVCTLLDLHNREIIGKSCGPNKDANLVVRAFSSVKADLRNINLLHSDRGNEYKNIALDEILTAFGINRSLSRKGCPYDNAVAESAFKSMKKEFIYQYDFDTLEMLETELNAYVWWWNNERIHSSLGYDTPLNYKKVMTL